MGQKITGNDKNDLEVIKTRWRRQLDRQGEYSKKNYDRINFVVQKGRKQDLLNRAKELGFKSLSEYMVYLVDEDMKNRQSENTTDDEVPF